MSDENNRDTLATLHQIAISTQQLFLLDMLKILLKATSQGDVKPSDISPAIKALNQCAKTRFDDPSFRHTWELIAASLTKATEREGKELGSTMPTAENNRYIIAQNRDYIN